MFVTQSLTLAFVKAFGEFKLISQHIPSWEKKKVQI